MLKLSMAKRLTAWFAIVLVLLLLNTFLSYRAVQTIIRNDREVARSHAELLNLELTLSTLKDAETGQRGFLLTGDEEYLEPYEQAISTIPDRLRDVKANGAQESDPREISFLQDKIDTKLSELKQTIEVRKDKGLEAALAIVRADRGKHAMDDIRQIVMQMRDRENLVLEQRAADSQASARQAVITLFFAGGLGLAMFLLFSREVRTRINEEHAAYQKAAEANRLKDEFLATISHELRTPLTALIGWARMLRLGGLDEERSQRALETIERNAQSQAQLVEDLLDVSSIVSGRLRLDVRPLDVTTVVRSAIESVTPAAEARQIRLTTALDPRAPRIYGDPERLQQVIWNLLSNAIKFTPKGGRVQVRVERTNSHVDIVVSDNGEGIHKSFLPHMFDRFTQQDASYTRKKGGLGLGLAITRHLVEMHGGNISAQSEGEGKGSVFTVTLPIVPLKQADANSAGAEHAHPTAASLPVINDLPALDGLRVMAVDDQRDTLDMLETVLSASRAEVRLANSAAQAMDILKTWKPDVIISDIGMPVADGYTLIQQIRALDPANGGRIPAIALTAYARVEDRIRTLSAGYQMHVAKPVDPAELVAVLASIAKMGSG